MKKVLGPITNQEFYISVEASLKRHKKRIVDNNLADMQKFHQSFIEAGYKAECADCNSTIEYRFANDEEFSIHLLHAETCPVPKQDRTGGYWSTPTKSSS